MNDSELNQLLKSVSVPEPGEVYWERFHKRVMAQIHWRGSRKAAAQDSEPGRRLRPLAITTAFVLMCLLAALSVLFSSGRNLGHDKKKLAQARKYLHELEALFPNQIQAIVFDERGPHLVLAQQATVPAAQALYLNICGPKGCKSYVTFSGQQIRLDGQVWDVLLDHRGNVLLVGDKLAWSSAGAGNTRPYRIAGKRLEGAS